jgi:hypothetical protein
MAEARGKSPWADNRSFQHTLAAGFPMAMLLSWLYEFTLQGISPVKMFFGFTLRELVKRSSPEALSCLSEMISHYFIWRANRDSQTV